MALRIGVLSNCQHESLAVALQALLPSAEIISYELNHVIADPVGRDRIAAALLGCDQVISQDIAPGYGPLGTRVLRKSVARFHLIPAFQFGGFHPDIVHAVLDRVPLEGPIGSLQSRIVLAAFLGGLSAEEAAAMFNSMVFGRLGYFDAAAEHSALLLEKFAAYDIDLSQHLPQWMAAGCFMHDPIHPKIGVFLDLARIACGMMGIVPEANPRITMLRDPLAAFPTFSFLPEIAARLGMRPEGAIRGALPSPPMTLPDFVQGSFKALRRAPLSCLRGLPGVMDAMTRLDLTPVRRTPVQKPPGDTGLLSWHGTVVRVENASTLLVHESLWPASEDCTDFAMDVLPGENGVGTAAILGGLTIEQGRDGAIVRRGGRAMVADAARLAVPFTGDGSTRDEAFLAVKSGVIEALRLILSRAWVLEDGSEVPAARIALRPGFKLDVGAISVDLRQKEPIIAASGTDIVLRTAIGEVSIKPAASSDVHEIALLPVSPRRAPEESGSMPEFRISPVGAWGFEAGEEIVHPPMTAIDRDTAWRYEQPPGAPKLPAGVRREAARMVRMPGKTVFLKAGLEGVLADEAGVWNNQAAIEVFRGRDLPAGVRQVDGVMLADRDALRAAPLVEGPVVVCISPDWQSYDDWLLGTAMKLRLMAPMLPAGARVLIPAGLAALHADGGMRTDHFGLLAAIGLRHLPLLAPDGDMCRLEDAIWLDTAGLPASLMRQFREDVAGLHPPVPGKPVRLYVKRPEAAGAVENPELDSFLESQDFITCVPEQMNAAEQVALFLQAETIVAAPGGNLTNMIFCPPGARVLDIVPRSVFQPLNWLLAEKCGLIYGVMPCWPQENAGDGALRVELARFRSLLRALRFSQAQ